jgi:fluoroquinolone transport system permease protein
MKRLAATLRREVILQARYRFYAVSVFVVLFWGVLLGLLPGRAALDPALVVPGFLMANLLVTTFYFVSALVLLEKGEGTLAALATTPLRESEYLAAKVISLVLLALVESLLVVVLIFGWRFQWALLLLGGVLLGALYTLCGFLLASRYDEINRFLMPSAVAVTLLSLPMLPLFGLADRALFLLHPVEPSVTLMRAAFGVASPADLAYGVLGSLAWTAAAFVLARRRLMTFMRA